jgi:hypothetical protein
MIQERDDSISNAMLPSVIKYPGNYSLATDEAVVVFYDDFDCLQKPRHRVNVPLC